jgi:hypothetical protein
MRGAFRAAERNRGAGETMAKKKGYYKVVPHGSDEHAALLGLTKGADGKYELQDPVPLVQLDPTGRLERVVLNQKIGALQTGFPKLQSRDPFAPNYAPPLWRPSDE